MNLDGPNHPFSLAEEQSIAQETLSQPHLFHYRQMIINFKWAFNTAQ